MRGRETNRNEKRERNIILKVLFRVLLIIAALALILSYCSVYINPIKFIIPLFFGLYFIPILLLNILLLFIALIFRSKAAWISIIALIPSLLFAERFYKIRGVKEQPFSTKQISIFSYNIGSFEQAENSETVDVKAILIDSIRKYNADIVCIQEYALFDEDTLEHQFRNYKYFATHLNKRRKRSKRHTGLVLFSKYEIVNSGNISFKESSNCSMFADIVIGKDTIRIFNNHLESYSLSFKSLIQKLKTKDTTTQMAKEEIYNVHKKIGQTVLRRTLQLDSLSKLIFQSPYPTIICGDQNETPMSYAYTTLSRGHNDTFKEAGKGFSSTFRIFYPLLRIDYIFTPKSIEVNSHKTLRWPYSDHYPIIARITVKNHGNNISNKEKNSKYGKDSL